MTAPAQPQQSNAGRDGAAAAIALAMAARGVQLAIRAQLLRDVVKLWPLLDRARLDETSGPWKRLMAATVGTYRDQSSVAAGRFYQAARAQALQIPTPASVVRLAPPADPEWVAQAFGYSGPGMLNKDTAVPNTALTTTLGTAARIVADAGRQTVQDSIKHDDRAVGWYRVTDAEPCAFCALLAARGVVYKKATVGFKSHNDCGCIGAPAFSRDHPLPELSQIAADVYLNRGDGPALPAFRKAWAERMKALREAQKARESA